MHRKALLIATVLAAIMLQTTLAYRSYQSRIPNGDNVPSPCPGGGIWQGVGHQGSAGGNTRNPFGVDFSAAGKRWTPELCRKDSDGDGLTNGQELGDPECVWTPGAVPQRTTGLSHPGICPLDSTTCMNPWTVCPKAFSCPEMNGPNVTVQNFTVNKNTPVPAKVTTYMCQAFELNTTATPVHMIGSRPIIVNTNIMHHMIMYACKTRPDQRFFDAPQECFMGRGDCTEILNLWGFGLEGECFNNNTGFRIGGDGYQYAMLELHWNNPTSQAGYVDSSGLSLYYTTVMRPYDQGTLMYGEANLVLKPRQQEISYNHTCPGVCTNKYHSETRYITSAGIHMHTYGIKGRISLWRNGTLIKDLHPLQVYDYNSPTMTPFDPPIEYRKGDEVKTECYFSTRTTNNTIFFGEGTGDEMCLSFLSYYPNNISQDTSEKLGQCIALSGINVCWINSGITPHVEQECNITAMRNGEIPNQVSASMTAKNCFSRTGCDPACRSYLNDTLWPSNACYDPKRARQMTALLATGTFVNSSTSVSETIAKTLYGQSYCEQEVAMLAELARQAAANNAAATMTPAATNQQQTGGRLTSEQLLIVIIVCSCLGFILLLAGLTVIASKFGGKDKSFPKTVAQMGGDNSAGGHLEKAYIYNSYENSSVDRK